MVRGRRGAHEVADVYADADSPVAGEGSHSAVPVGKRQLGQHPYRSNECSGRHRDEAVAVVPQIKRRSIKSGVAGHSDTPAAISPFRFVPGTTDTANRSTGPLSKVIMPRP